ncbi:sigma-54-dependent transcriptional regulator [Desulfovibrio sp. SGI.169]|uniref:sigma-54-dependent transcriptional regulator n=1 Tax=Desulfovibrio sp. SGI.169 TaxID=3420561 RepID=UPI003D061907
MARILVVDDEALMRTMVEVVCTRLGHEAVCAATLKDGLSLGRRGVDVVLLDAWLPDGNGLEFQSEFAHLPHKPDIVVITGHGDGDAAEAALRSGAWEFLSKPLKIRDIEQCLRHVLAFRQGRKPCPAELKVDSGHILGSGPGMTRALKLLAQAAQSEVNVLITGETGVGKELFARALFRNSNRAARPFVTVDCASLPETLVESHLFGHSRGAFTGAERAREGLLLAAHRGTLFLDEVGDLPLAMQGAFLRALELRRFRPVGEVREVDSDFRLVAATNRDLEGMARGGQFRGDLLYRLQGISIVIPPLRERRDEIPSLARQAVTAFCLRNDLPEKLLAEPALDMLMEYHWPGNVRELIHALERSCLAAGQGELILPGHLPTQMRVAVTRSRVSRGRERAAEAAPPQARDAAPAYAGDSLGPEQGAAAALPSLRDWKARAEEEYVRRVMAVSAGDARRAAALAGISRGHWYELIRKYHI